MTERCPASVTSAQPEGAGRAQEVRNDRPHNRSDGAKAVQRPALWAPAWTENRRGRPDLSWSSGAEVPGVEVSMSYTACSLRTIVRALRPSP